MKIGEGVSCMYNAIDVAKYVVTKCENESCPISNLQLQKILYYIQKEYLQGDDIAFGDNIEAWQFGPVVPDVYYAFSGFGSMPITMKYRFEITQKDKDKFDPIIEAKRCLNPWDLVEDTHKADGPWQKIYGKDGHGNRKIIPLDVIKKYG